MNCEIYNNDETYNGDEILNKECSWCNTTKEFMRSIQITNINTIWQEDGGICLDCYQNDAVNHTFICEECIDILDKYKLNTNVNKKIHSNYYFDGKLSICKQCFIKKYNINNQLDNNQLDNNQLDQILSSVKSNLSK